MVRPFPNGLASLIRYGATVAIAIGFAAPTATAASFQRDLLAMLARAHVCPLKSNSCVPAPVAETLHHDASRPGLVRLPPNSATNLYLRMPEAPVLAVEFSTPSAGLVVTAAVSDQGRREVYHKREASGSAVIDLAPFAGEVVRVSLQPLPADTAVYIRRAVLRTAALDDHMAPHMPTDTAPAPRANVVIYVVDTLRADHLGCYGYGRPTSPRIDGFARSALLFRHTVAQSSWTLPSVASLLTGLLPQHHGAVSPTHRLITEATTLAEILRSHGYTTAAFVTNYLGSDVFGLGRGFDIFRFFRERGDRRRSVYLRSDALFGHVEKWLDGALQEPFLLYVHATDPHFPYVPLRRYAGNSARDGAAAIEAARPYHNGRERWGTRPVPLTAVQVANLRKAYDGEIRMADAYFGRLLDALRDRGLHTRTVVVFTSDHGEEFLEHGGVGHGQTLHREVLDVPLLVRVPGQLSGRIDAPAEHIDIVPTILSAVGMPIPPTLDGRSLLARRGRARRAEAHASLRLAGFALDALVDPSWKVIRDLEQPRGQRFTALTASGDHDARASVLIGYTRSRLRELGAVNRPGPRVPQRLLAPLAALGYVVD